MDYILLFLKDKITNNFVNLNSLLSTYPKSLVPLLSWVNPLLISTDYKISLTRIDMQSVYENFIICLFINHYLLISTFFPMKIMPSS